jgi:hypothetical protein
MTARDAAIVGLSAVIDRRYRAGCWSQSLCYMPLDCSALWDATTSCPISRSVSMLRSGLFGSAAKSELFDRADEFKRFEWFDEMNLIADRESLFAVLLAGITSEGDRR